MQERIIRHGRTVEEALENALRDLEASRDQVEVDVLEEGASGFLGIIGQREATVEVRMKESKEDFVEEFLKTVLKAIDSEAEISIRSDEDAIYVDVDGESLGLIIGRRGDTLNALQYLLNVTAGKRSSDRRSIRLDAGDFRSRRRRELEQMVLRLADRVAKTRRPFHLDPMPPHERKIVHTVLQTDDRVRTESEGMDPKRHIIIHPA